MKVPSHLLSATEVTICRNINVKTKHKRQNANQFINLLCKSMDWFLYDNGLRHERVKALLGNNFPQFD